MRLSDDGGPGLQTAGSSQIGPIGEALSELVDRLPELRPALTERRYNVRIPEDTLPSPWSIADWLRTNSDWDAAFWSYDGMQKGANIRALQRLAEQLGP